MTEEPKSQGWWHTVSGILTATAGIITAVTSLVVIVCEIVKPNDPNVPKVKELAANSRDWFDTEIDVTSGQLLEITASGQINFKGGKAEGNSGPEGNSHILCDYPGCVDRRQPAGKLYGKIGNSLPFSIGTNATFHVGNGGRLQMKINDAFFDDNSGKFTVTIVLTHPK